ncbi:MAG: hypothetical protein HY901_22280, partial [Deltaproteobacteria bacterium]|nr:hypothetical protein [Deltaproteobacteria bacterium]
LAVADNDSANGASDKAAFDAEMDGFRTKGTVAKLLYGVGAAAAVAGLVLTLWPRAGNDGPKVAIAPTPGGAALTVAGGF